MSDLYFRLGEMKGFTAIELANKSEGYANPIRELLQNSLDASHEAERGRCEVDIYIQTIDKTKIPHIEDYKRVLQKAIETHKRQNSLNANNRRVVDSIQNTLDEQKIEVLMFADNGTGMNPKKVDAILTGTSIHDDEQSGGSFGVGHLSSYSLSSLRYVLYATKYQQGGKSKSLFTGSPILAGHKDGANQRGSRGRIVEAVPANENDPKFIYPNQFPDFIAPKMEKLDRGTMVSILGLAEEWDEEAEYAIVSNFFHAIGHDALIVKIHKDGQPTKLIGGPEVESLIASRSEGKRAMGENILSGKAVYQAWSAVFGQENQKQIRLSNGELVYVCIKADKDSTPTITLIRNGMLIARHDTMLSDDMNSLRKSENVEPFTAVIDVAQGHSPELFNLVKGAEGPYHNRLEKGRLRASEEKELKKLFKELSAKIGEHLPKMDRESINLPLFSIPNEDARAGGGRKSSGQTPKAKPRGRKIPPKPKPPTPRPHPPRPKPKVVSRSLAAKTAVRYADGGDTWKVELRVIPKAQNARDEVYLSVCVGEDDDNINAQTYLDFVAVTVNGREVKIPEAKNQVKLGKLKESTQYDIVVQVEKPANMGNMKVALLPILGLKRTQTASTKWV